MYLAGYVFLAAKTAAHQGRDNVHLFRFDTQGCCGLVTIQVGNLAANIYRCFVVCRCFTTYRFGITSPPKISRAVAGRYTDGAFRFKEQMFGGGCAVGPVNDHIGFGEAGRSYRRSLATRR